MTQKYIIAEVSDGMDLENLINLFVSHCNRLAVVNKVDGIFEQTEYAAYESPPKFLMQKSVLPPKRVYTRKGVVQQAVNDRNFDNSAGSVSQEFATEEQKPKEQQTSKQTLEEFVQKRQSGEHTIWQDLEESLLQASFIEVTDEVNLPAMQKVDNRNSKKKVCLPCKLCGSKMSLRANYGRTRMREHVQRHLNICTAACGHCDFKGVLRDHVRRHNQTKHIDADIIVVDLPLDEDYEERYKSLWECCFPSIPMIAAKPSEPRKCKPKEAFL